MSAHSRPVAKVAQLTKKYRKDDGFKAAQLQSRIHFNTNPFIQVDHFHGLPLFPPHPHAGICAIMLMLEDSEGSFINRDSFGNTFLIQPGDLHCTTAGSGIVHEEIPSTPGCVCHGLQILINLPSKDKETKPQVNHLSAPDVPVHDADGVRTRVLAGEYKGLKSPLSMIKPVTLLDIFISPGTSFNHSTPHDDNVFAIVIKGKGQFGIQKEDVSENEAAYFDSGTEVQVQNPEPESLHLLLFQGAPINENVVSHGPFIGVSQDQIRSFALNYQLGRMGHLSRSSAFDEE